jgi:hypothetical protein
VAIFPGVVDLQRLHFLAATTFVPLEGMMIFIGDLYDFARLGFHSRHGLVFARVDEGLGREIVVSFG